MLARATIPALAAAALLAACGDGGLERAEAPAPAFAHQGSDLTPDPRIRYGVLENGFRYAIMPNATPAGAVSMRLAFDVGSLVEADAERGMAHFLEHMAFNGSANMPEGELLAMLERQGLSRGANVNASTTFDSTVYLAELPDADADTLDAGFMLFSELNDLTLAEDAVERERGVVLAEMRRGATPQKRVTDAQYAFLYPDAQLGRRPVIGTEDSLAAIDAAGLRSFYERFYTPDRAFLAVVGDIDPADIEARIRAGFGDWTAPQPATVAPDLGAVSSDAPMAGFIDSGDAPSSVAMYVVRPAQNLRETRAVRESDIIVRMAHAIVARRLATIVRSGQTTIQGPRAAYGEREDTADGALIDAQVRPGAWREGLTILEHEKRRALEFGFTQAEVDEQVATMRAQLTAQRDQAGSTPSAALVSQIIAEFRADDVVSAPDDELALFEELAARLTPEAVSDAFRAVWAGVPPIVFVADAGLMEDAEAAILAAYAAAAAEPLEAPSQAAPAPFAHTDFGPAGEVVWREADDALGLVRIRFANGVMLNVKHTDFAPGAVSAVLFFGDGLLGVPADRPELRFVVSVLTPGGTEAHSIDELQRLMAGRRVAPNFALSDDMFLSLPAQLPLADLETQLQLWAAYLAAPGFRPEAFAQFVQAYELGEARAGMTAASALSRNLDGILRVGEFADPNPPLERVATLTPDTARAALEAMLDRSPIQIAIVGDISEEEATMAVARTFGALPARSGPPRDAAAGRTARFPDPGTVSLTHRGPADQAIALIAWPATDSTDQARARRLRVLAQALQQRVTDTLRETMGSSYAPQATAVLSPHFPGYGLIRTQVDVKPEDMEAAFAAIEAEAADLAAGGLTQDELDRALQPILDSFDARDQQNMFWVMTIGRAQTRPEELERALADPADFATITLADIGALAAEYLDPAKAVRIEVLPDGTD